MTRAERVFPAPLDEATGPAAHESNIPARSEKAASTRPIVSGIQPAWNRGLLPTPHGRQDEGRESCGRRDVPLFQPGWKDRTERRRPDELAQARAAERFGVRREGSQPQTQQHDFTLE